MSHRLRWQDHVVTSSMVIEHTSVQSGESLLLVRQVVDGFWDYVSRPIPFSRHRTRIVPETSERAEMRYDELSIPHFGKFQAIRIPQYGIWVGLRFRSTRIDALGRWQDAAGGHHPSEDWVSMLGQEDPVENTGLSVKRHISCCIARECNLDLATAYRVLWHFLETVAQVFVHGRQKISFFRRGVMYPYGVDNPQASTRYRFRCYASYRDKLKAGA